MAEATRPSRKPAFRVEEASIAQIHAAMLSHKLTCVGLIQTYLDRIAAYEPVFNAFVEINPDALAQAAALDRLRRPKGPLHCIPVAVKDAVDSEEMPSSGGSMPLSRPAPDDATVLARLREAGAIILGKTNMDELGRGSSGLSTKGGQTGNAYDPTRIPGGSSGGSAVAVAANLTTVAIAEETGVSIRNPCANANIACIAPTQGLVSRDGVIPISFTQDRLGQYGKTIVDAARVLDVIAGFDPKDPVTANSVGREPFLPYALHAAPGKLRGKRLGVVREFMTVASPSDEESVALAEDALDDLAALGASLVDPLPVDAAMGALLPVLNPAYFPNAEWDFPCDSEMVIAGDCPNPGFARVVGSARTNSYEFAFAFNRYLKGRGDPLVPDLDAFIAIGPFFSTGFRNGLVNDGARTTLNDPEYLERLLRRKTIGEVVAKLMADHDLDALVFPMKTQPAGKIGAPGNSSGQILSSSSGLPSVLIPIGFTQNVVDRISGGGTVVTPAAMPVALEFLGRPYTEGTLIGIAASYEAATKHRRPSPFAPPLN
jgi:Asp-tRNA(Asn)/Glu-tRNA(Gln) amidotransferase A subunit family amidase